MHPVKISLHNFTIIVEPPSEANNVATQIFTELKRSFASFVVFNPPAREKNTSAETCVAIVRLDAVGLAKPRGLVKFKTALGLVFWSAGTRHIQFSSGAVARFTFTPRPVKAEFELATRADVALVENFIHATFGEALEAHGFLRIHALAAADKSPAQVFYADQGAGKSVQALRWLQKSKFMLLSDEVVFLRDDRAFAYPIPIAISTNWLARSDSDTTSGLAQSFDTREALRDREFLGATKRLFTIPFDRVAIQTQGFQINVVCQSLPQGFNKHLMFISWCVRFTLGLGLPQMREYLIRQENLFWLVRLAFRRFAFARRQRIQFISLSDFRADSFTARPWPQPVAASLPKAEAQDRAHEPQ